ncbi:hypothetical protein TH53_00315 [Pedobacter lusitanus]|uniref:histidine kinase n=2 Tax=Pedobacter lusitanus TaxID=1503925 RepID=A0A0D0GX06_9SPHI|nr:hypothetical protein TH53_00315 [Pedobacter lusitanus]
MASDALQKAYDQSTVESLVKLSKKKEGGGKKKPSTSLQMLTVFPIGVKLHKKMDSVISNATKGLTDGKVIRKTELKNTTITLSHKWSDGSDSVVNQKINSKATNLDVNHFLAGMLSAAQVVEVDTALVRKNLKKELKIRRVTLPFSLKLFKKDTLIRNENAGVISKSIVTSQNKVTLLLKFEEVGAMLFLKIFWPVTLSFFLVLLIVGCIWVLWRIIVQQKKLEVMKNDFISNISHELKTPLSILSATNEVLLKFGGIKDQEKTERYLLLEQAELRKLQSLIENILTLTRMEHQEDKLIGPYEKTDLKVLLNTVLPRFSELPGVTIHTELFLDDPYLNTHPGGLKIILSNLIDNAIKYTQGAQKDIFVRLEERKEHVVFSVRDLGIGIDKAYLPFIFDKFYRVPHGDVHEVKGYGLGLSYVKTTVQKLGGAVRVESILDKGTIFVFQLKKS